MSASAGRRLVVAVLALAAAAAAAGRLRWAPFHTLHDEGRLENGWVTAKDPGSRAVYYSFKVKERDRERVYSGIGRAGHGNPDFDRLGIGDRVLVAYLPRDPSASRLGDPEEYLRSQSYAMIYGMVFGIPLAAWGVYRGFKKEAG
jgi:hypothetical protein